MQRILWIFLATIGLFSWPARADLEVSITIGGFSVGRVSANESSYAMVQSHTVRVAGTGADASSVVTIVQSQMMPLKQARDAEWKDVLGRTLAPQVVERIHTVERVLQPIKVEVTMPVAAASANAVPVQRWISPIKFVDIWGRTWRDP